MRQNVIFIILNSNKISWDTNQLLQCMFLTMQIGVTEDRRVVHHFGFQMFICNLNYVIPAEFVNIFKLFLISYGFSS